MSQTVPTYEIYLDNGPISWAGGFILSLDQAIEIARETESDMEAQHGLKVQSIRSGGKIVLDGPKLRSILSP